MRKITVLIILTVIVGGVFFLPKISNGSKSVLPIKSSEVEMTSVSSSSSASEKSAANVDFVSNTPEPKTPKAPAKPSSVSDVQPSNSNEATRSQETVTHSIQLTAKSFLSGTAKANINTALANEGQFFEVPNNIFGHIKESSLVTFEYNGRRLEGKTSYFESNDELSSSFTEVTFPNSKLKIFEKNGYIRGTLTDNGTLYQIEGFQNEWSIMEFYKYKRLNNALTLD